MAGKIKSKYKLSRRLGANIFGSEKEFLVKKNYKPGQHGRNTRKRSKYSEYGAMLGDYKKIQCFYGGMTKRSIRTEAINSKKKKGTTTDNLAKLLESHLSTFVYRIKWAATIHHAKQIISHKNIRVNGKIVNIHSYKLKPGDNVSLSPELENNNHVIRARNLSNRTVPEYIKTDGNLKGTLISLPNLNGIFFPSEMNFQKAINFLLR